MSQMNMRAVATNMQHFAAVSRAIPLKSPSGVLHRPGFRVPSAAPGRSGLLDSIPSSKSNARFSYARSLSGLTVRAPRQRMAPSHRRHGMPASRAPHLVLLLGSKL